MAGDQKSDSDQELQGNAPKEQTKELPEDPRLKSKSERAEVAIEVTQLKSERFLEKPNAPEFTQLNLNESLEKQEALLSSLAGTAVFELIPFLVNEKGILPEHIQNFFRDPPFEMAEVYFKAKSNQGTEDLVQAFLKIREIITSSPAALPDGQKSVRQFWDENWGSILAKGQSAAALMSNFQKNPDSLQNGQFVTEALLPGKEEKSFFEKHSTKLLVGALGLGLIGGTFYYVTRGSKKDRPAEESPDFIGKIFKAFGVLGLIAGVGFGLGRLSEISTVRKWLKSFGIDDAVAMQALRLASHGEFEKAYALLSGGNEREQTFDAIVAKINSNISGATVKSSTIDKIRTIPYRELFPDNFLDAISKGAKDLAGAGFRQLPLLKHFLNEDPDFEKELLAIEQFITLPENQEKMKKIAPGPRMTVSELLSRLCDVPASVSTHSSAPLIAAAVVPAGKVGAEVARRSQERQAGIQQHRGKIIESLDKDHSLDQKTHELLLKDADSCLRLINEIDTSSRGWWSREKELARQLWRDLNANLPDKAYTEQDFLASYDQLQEVDSTILQDLRTQVSGIQALKDGKKVSAAKLEKIKDEIADFYHNYHLLQAKLDEMNQTRIKEQEERAALMKSGSFKADFEKVKTGTQLVLNTFFGMPASVVFLREDNGTLVSMLGAASTATATIGFVRGIAGAHGGLVPGITGAAKGALQPISKGFALSRWSFERLDYWHKTTTLRAVQEGRLTIPQGIKRIEQYLNLYHYEWRDGTVQEWQSKPGTIDKMKSFGRAPLKHDWEKELAKQLEELKDLESKNYKTWAEAVKAGEKPDFVLAQKLLKEMEVKTLQTAMDDAVKSIANELEPASFEALKNSEKIEALSKAHKQADVYLEKAIEKAASMRRAGVPPSEIEDFMKASQQELKGIRDSFGASFAKVQALAKTPEEIAALEKLVAKELSAGKAIRAVIKPVGSELMKSMKFKGKFALVLGSANIVYGLYKASEKEQQDYTMNELLAIGSEIGLDTLQLVVDVMAPFGLTNWYAAIEGKEVITQKNLDGSARAKHVLFGTFSLVTDVLAVVAGGATAEVGGAGGAGIYMGANAVEAALKGAGKSAKIMKAVEKILPRLSALAKNSGGFSKLMTILKSEKFLKALRGTQIVTGGAMLGTVAYDAYQIIYDTKDQPEQDVALSDETAKGILQKQQDEMPKGAEIEEINLGFKNKKQRGSTEVHVPQKEDGFEGQLE